MPQVSLIHYICLYDYLLTLRQADIALIESDQIDYIQVSGSILLWPHSVLFHSVLT